MRKLTVRKHVHVSSHKNDVPTKSHSDGQNPGYFPRTLWAVLLALGYSKPMFFIGTLRLLCGNSYLWCVRVVIYEIPTADHIRRICQVIEASTLSWTFDGVMKEATREALVVLRHEANEQMEHSQYRHFLSRAKEGAKAMVLPARDHDRIGCFND
jgi:hypothetical protein